MKTIAFLAETGEKISPVMGLPVGEYLVVFPLHLQVKGLDVGDDIPPTLIEPPEGYMVLYQPSGRIVGDVLGMDRAIAFAESLSPLLGETPAENFYRALANGVESADRVLKEYSCEGL